MTAATTAFERFLENIRLTPELRDDCEKAHSDLRQKLLADEMLRPHYVSMFLQGSYARHTGTKPNGTDTHVDVDLVLVTDLDPSPHGAWTPQAVLELFRPFLDREYTDQWKPNDRSMKISPAGLAVTLDLVVTTAPTEIRETLTKAYREIDEPTFRIEARGERDEGITATFREALEKADKAYGSADWQRLPLLIPDREMKEWEPTHPLEQIRWTTQKNADTDGHFVNVVKAIKWWRKVDPRGEHPKSYPLEHLIGDTCPDGVDSVAAGVTAALVDLRDSYRPARFPSGVPVLYDRGVPTHNVWKRITTEEYATFHRLASQVADSAEDALAAPTNTESVAKWHAIFGDEFPEPDPAPFTPPGRAATPTTSGRYG